MDTLQQKKAFYKRTRKGKVIRLVRETYHRSDVGCGYICGKQISEVALCEAADGAPHKLLLFIDTNIALHQIDILEYKCPATSLIVIVQTVLQELHHLNVSVYRRLLALMKDESRSYIFFPNEISSDTQIARDSNETPNNYNDRLIRICAQYFQSQLSTGRVLLLTNDRDNAMKAKELGLLSMSMRGYVEQYLQQYPELLDLVAIDDSYMKEHSTEHKNALFPAYISPDALLHGVKTHKYLKGTLRSRGSNHADGYVVVHSQDKKAERVAFTIQGSVSINRALDGDVVAIEEISQPAASVPESAPAPGVAIPEETAPISNDQLESLVPATRYARVVGIIRRNWRHYAGSVDMNQVQELSDEGTMVMFRAVDPKIPPIYITTRRLDEISNKRILVTIDTWPVTSEYPCGHYVRILGDDGDKQVETNVLLHEFGVSHEAFSTDVMACLPPADWKIDEELIATRTDLRHISVTSIDPPGCKDIDDALHCRVLPNGNYEVGVHIADVSHFVHPDTPIDKEAAHRSTTTYLVERRLDMLPGLLTTDLCSLRCDEDHLVFSVIWEMDTDANIIDVQCFKAVIHSVASFTYDQAQTILDDKCSYDVYKTYSKSLAKSEQTYNEVVQSVRLLNMLAKKLRQRRLSQGALMLASPEVRFKFDETNNPTDVTSYELKESNKLVEEWMLIANITVSKKILRHFPTLGVLRRHAPPSKEQFAPLVSAARAVGIDIDISTSKTLADSLDHAVLPNDEYFNKLIRILSTRCMMPAQYFCSGELPVDQWHHYGLAAPVYTHFTSPIRRYADLVVHRLLAASLNIISLPVGYADRSKQQDLCNHMNRRHRAAQHVQRASVNLHTLLYFKNKPTVETAYVLTVQPDKLIVLVPRFGIEGSIHYDQIFHAVVPDVKPEAIENKVHFDAEQHIIALEHPQTAQVFVHLKVFQKVNVHIAVEDPNTSNRKLVISLVIEEAPVVENGGAIKKKKRSSVDSSDNSKPPAKKSKGKGKK